MKNKKGITLISLIIYIILMTFTVGIIGTITANFYGNLNKIDKDSKGAVAYAKFNMYILNDMKTDGMTVNDVTNTKIELEIPNSDETIRYTVEDGGLYRNSVKICDGVKEYKFSPRKTGANAEITGIMVTIKINDYIKTTTYAVENVTEDDPRNNVDSNVFQN